jgi:uncharacterized protein (TIGR00730 family)
MNVAVFCSSSDSVSPMLLAEAELLGENLAKDGHAVIYGGAHCGCMGALARGVLSQKGELVGVVPEMDFMKGWVQEGLSRQIVVSELSGRKDVMLRESDAYVVFPGGVGTLDEAFEAMALKSIGTLRKPIIFYNFLGVWTPLLEALDLLVSQNLIRDSMSELIHVVDKQEQIREHLIHVL